MTSQTKSAESSLKPWEDKGLGTGCSEGHCRARSLAEGSVAVAELPARTDSASAQENEQSKKKNGGSSSFSVFPWHDGCLCVSLLALVKKPPRLFFGFVPLNLSFKEEIWSSFLMLFLLALTSYFREISVKSSLVLDLIS